MACFLYCFPVRYLPTIEIKSNRKVNSEEQRKLITILKKVTHIVMRNYYRESNKEKNQRADTKN